MYHRPRLARLDVDRLGSIRRAAGPNGFHRHQSSHTNRSTSAYCQFSSPIPTTPTTGNNNNRMPPFFLRPLCPILRHCAVRTTRRSFAAAAAAAGSPTSVRVEETREEGGGPYAVTGRSGRHTLRGDLMPPAGGQDIGPSPKEYVLMALGSCTAMTMRMYSDNMIRSGKWPGRTVRKLAVECEEYNGGEDKHLPAGIRVTVSLDSDLDEGQIQRLLAAASKCPVKRMLKGELKDGVTTMLAAAEGKQG